MGKNVHVIPRQGQWAVKKEGNQRATSIHSTQRDAIDTARETAKAEKSELVIHNRNGQIRNKNSYGNDPFPPRDTKP